MGGFGGGSQKNEKNTIVGSHLVNSDTTLRIKIKKTSVNVGRDER